MATFYKRQMSALVAVPPACLGNPMGFIERMLDQQLFKQLDNNGEVLLTYSDLICAPLGKVSYYQPEVLVDIQFTGLIFAPGEEVLAEVKNVSGNKVQLLVYGVFEGKAQFSDDIVQLDQGQLIKCRVKELVRSRNTMLFILEDIQNDSGFVDGRIEHDDIIENSEQTVTQSEIQNGPEAVVP